MPSYTFTLNVETEIAEARLRAFRTTAEKELSGIQAATVGKATSGGTNAVESEWKRVEAQLQKVGHIDLTLPADQLAAALLKVKQEIRSIDAALQSAAVRGGGSTSPVYRGKLDDYYANLARTQGQDAADLARNSGMVGNIGQIGAQHPNDTRPVEEFTQNAYAQVESVRQQSRETIRNLMEKEASLYTLQGTAAKAEQTLVAQRMSMLESQLGTDDDGQLLQAYNRAVDEQALLKAAELEAANNLTNVKRRLREHVDADAATTRQAAMNSGDLSAVGTGGTGRVSITVSDKSAANVERLVPALEQVAGLETRITAETQKQTEARQRSFQSEVEILGIKGRQAAVTEQELENIRTAGEKARLLQREELGDAQRKKKEESPEAIRGRRQSELDAEVLLSERRIRQIQARGLTADTADWKAAVAERRRYAEEQADLLSADLAAGTAKDVAAQSAWIKKVASYDATGRSIGSGIAPYDASIQGQQTRVEQAEAETRKATAREESRAKAIAARQDTNVVKEQQRQQTLAVQNASKENIAAALQETSARVVAAQQAIAVAVTSQAEQTAAAKIGQAQRIEGIQKETLAKLTAARQELAAAEMLSGEEAIQKVAAAKATIAEIGAEESRLTNIVKSETEERIQLAKKEAAEKIESAVQQRTIAQGDQRRVLAAPDTTKVKNQWSSLDHVLKTGFLAYGAYLAASQAITGIYDFGKVGAQQERTAQTFEQLAKRIGVSADGMRAAVQRASRGTIDDMTGMGLGAQVLAQNFAGSLDDIEGDTEILIRAARRFSQVYTDENGQNLSTQAIYARLIKFSREGNKELVDQFGLSNELIAGLLNIPNIGLRGAEGAANRWKGMIMALELELKKLGEATETPADKIEAAEARWTTAVNKIRESTIGISTGMAEAGAGMFEFLADWQNASNLNNKNVFTTRPEMESLQKSDADGTDNVAIKNAVRAFQELDVARARGEIGWEEYWKGIESVIQQFHLLNEAIYGVKPAMDEMNKTVAAFLAMQGGGGLTREDFPGTSGGASAALRQQAQARQRNLDLVAGRIAPADLSESESKYRMAVGGAAERLAILKAAVDAAEEGTDEWMDAMAALSGAQLSLAGDIDAVKGKFMGLQSDIEQYQLDLRLGAAGNDAEKRAILQGLNLSDTTPEGRRNALEIQNLDRSIAQENKRLGEEAAREWKQTAKDVEQMFESAADKIMGIPGVTSLTPVTEQEMLDTRYGAYTDKADEWVRRVRDELQNFTRDTRTDENGVTTETLRPRVTRDYADVSREQVEKLTGMPAGTPHDVMIPRLERMWESGSLFADKGNLGLMNMDSIRASFEEMKQGATGRQNQRQYIMDQLGVSLSDASLITGTQAPIVQMMTGGQSEEEITAQLGPVANTLRTAAMASLTSGTGFMAEISAGWKKDIDENIAKLDPLGDMIGKRLRDRINTTIGGLGLIDGIVARVIAELAEGV